MYARHRVGRVVVLPGRDPSAWGTQVLLFSKREEGRASNMGARVSMGWRATDIDGDHRGPPMGPELAD